MGLISNIKAAIQSAFGQNEPGEPPPWVKDLKPAKYTSQSGVEIGFEFLDLEFFIPVKSASFGNVDGDGAYIQHNGIGGGRYPMLMVFTGGDNNERAKTALKALIERGDGTLHHPVLGPITVVPLGEIHQINAFVTEAGQTSIGVEFGETTGLLIDDLPSFGSVLDSYLENAANSFGDVVSVADKADEVSLGQKVLGAIKNVKKALNAVSEGIAKTQAQMDDTFDSINGAIDTLVKDPIMLARQMQNLVMTPAYELSMIKDKMEAYKNLAASVFLDFPLPNGNTYDNTGRNDYAVNSLIAGAAIAGLVNTSHNAGTSEGDNAPKYKKDFVKAQSDMADSVKNYVDWADDGAVSLGLTNNSGDFGELNDALTIATRKIIEKLTVAQSEINVRTTYDRPAMAWCYEFYRSVKPDMLTYFQQTNDLGGDEIFIIKSGRDLVYYA